MGAFKIIGRLAILAAIVPLALVVAYFAVWALAVGIAVYAMVLFCRVLANDDTWRRILLFLTGRWDELGRDTEAARQPEERAQ